MLQSLSEKLGTALVIFKKNEGGSWQRFCVAARFSKGYACMARGAQPVILTLENKHYKSLRIPRQTAVPDAWLREGCDNWAAELSGGGVKTPKRLPSRSDTVVLAHGLLILPGWIWVFPMAWVPRLLTLWSGMGCRWRPPSLLVAGRCWAVFLWSSPVSPSLVVWGAKLRLPWCLGGVRLLPMFPPWAFVPCPPPLNSLASPLLLRSLGMMIWGRNRSTVGIKTRWMPNNWRNFWIPARSLEYGPVLSVTPEFQVVVRDSVGCVVITFVTGTRGLTHVPFMVFASLPTTLMSVWTSLLTLKDGSAPFVRLLCRQDSVGMLFPVLANAILSTLINVGRSPWLPSTEVGANSLKKTVQGLLVSFQRLRRCPRSWLDPLRTLRSEDTTWKWFDPIGLHGLPPPKKYDMVLWSLVPNAGGQVMLIGTHLVWAVRENVDGLKKLCGNVSSSKKMVLTTFSSCWIPGMLPGKKSTKLWAWILEMYA